MLRVVNELLLTKKELFSSGKHKLTTATHATQGPILEIHFRLSDKTNRGPEIA